jgi:uncharacterized RDD family membrane protein YckC
MKNIEIKTTQNVVLQYELADVKDRVLAFAIDFISVMVTILILASIGAPAFSRSETTLVIFSVFLTCIFMFYSLAFELLNNGQSLGKMALRIQVIRTAGGRATFSDYVARWVFRLVDIYLSFGGLACILIASSSKAQRIGDIVANTAVVKLTPKMNLRLKDVLTIHSQSSYTPAYPQAKQLKEEEVLLIKSALDRSRKYNNDAHHEALSLLSARVAEIVEAEQRPSDHRTFLQTVMKDYVVLTR